jgi:hypothetical protein
MDAAYEKLLGLILKEIRPFEAEAKEPLFYLRTLLKKGYTEDELNELIPRLKKDKVILKDEVVGDHEFDRVVEIDPLAIVKLAKKDI